MNFFSVFLLLFLIASSVLVILSSSVFINNSISLNISTSFIKNDYITVENYRSTSSSNNIPIPLQILFATNYNYPNQTKIIINGPVPVIVVIHFVMIKNVNPASSTFDTKFYLNLYWPDDSVCTGNDLTK